MKITLVTDNPNSWFNPYVQELAKRLKAKKHHVKVTADHAAVLNGDVAFYLSCEQKIASHILKRNKNNIVVHSSKLPKGKGWSPMTWQILEGKNKITTSLFEAGANIDAGPIYLQMDTHLKGHELIEEWRSKQGETIIKMILEFTKKYPHLKAKAQRGSSTRYQRRTPKDSELDIHQSIQEQFNLLRVVDNERYPAFFRYKGHKYILKISKND